jgi:hypothetical protein
MRGKGARANIASMSDDSLLRRGEPPAPQGAGIDTALRTGNPGLVRQWDVSQADIGKATLERHGFASWNDLDASLRRPGVEVSELTVALETAIAPAREFDEDVSADEIAEAALVAVPLAVFLDSLEEAIQLPGERQESASSATGVQRLCRDHLDKVLSRHGSLWDVTTGNGAEWRGDAGAAAILVGPALDALADPRPAAARDEFQAAIKHLRADTDKGGKTPSMRAPRRSRAR